MCSLRLCYFQNRIELPNIITKFTRKKSHSCLRHDLSNAVIFISLLYYQVLYCNQWQDGAGHTTGEEMLTAFQYLSRCGLGYYLSTSSLWCCQSRRCSLCCCLSRRGSLWCCLSSSCSLCYCLSSSCSLCYCLSSSCRLCYCLSITRNLWCCLSNSCIPKNMYVCVIFLAAQEISLIEKQ